MTLHRVNTSGGGFTKDVNFYLRSSNTGTNGTIITPISVTNANNYSGTGLNIFIDSNLPNPIVSPAATTTPNSGNRFLRIIFDGNASGADTVTVVFNVTLPANLNFTATQNLAFNAYFGCDIQGGSANGQEQTGTISNAVVFPINVPSALRASFAGGLVGATPALAFGEIGNEVAGGKLTPVNNYIRVQATAPYKVNLSSERDFRMTPGGTATANANERIGYNLKFLGITKTAGTVGGIVNKLCNRPGVGDNLEDKLYIQAQLAEAGAGKAPSTNYFDTLTVTIEPLAIPATDPGFVCGGAGNGQF